MTKFHLLKIRTSTDIFSTEKCKVTIGLEYILKSKSGVCHIAVKRCLKSNSISKTFCVAMKWHTKNGLQYFCMMFCASQHLSASFTFEYGLMHI